MDYFYPIHFPCSFLVLLSLCCINKATNLTLKANDTSILQSDNFPQPYLRNKVYEWNLVSPVGSTITLRNSYLVLYRGDELLITENVNGVKVSLGSYSWDSSLKKLTSLTHKVALTLRPDPNDSSSILSMNSNIIGFNFTAEITGFCDGSAERLPCGQSPGCYSASQDRCDGSWDCPLDGADEAGCPPCSSKGQFPCTNPVFPTCYSLHERCDGTYHCDDRSDEKNCLPEQCSIGADRFHCNSGGGGPADQRGDCVSLDRVCNGIVDCPQSAADEADAICKFQESNISLLASRVVQRIASRVARRLIDQSIATASVRLSSKLRTVLTYGLSALLGSLLIVLTMGFVCRNNASSATNAAGRSAADAARRARRSARYNSPIQRLLREEIRRRPPPPTYCEALNNSLFEEPIIEGVTPPAPPEPLPGALSQARIAAVRAESMKPTPVRVDVACLCDFPPLPPPPAPQQSIQIPDRMEEEENDADGDQPVADLMSRGGSRLRRWFRNVIVVGGGGRGRLRERRPRWAGDGDSSTGEVLGGGATEVSVETAVSDSEPEEDETNEQRRAAATATSTTTSNVANDESRDSILTSLNTEDVEEIEEIPGAHVPLLVDSLPPHTPPAGDSSCIHHEA